MYKYKIQGRRILAFIVDGVILVLPFFILKLNTNIDQIVTPIGFYSIKICTPLAYSIIMNFFFSATVGKMIMEIKINDINEEKKRMTLLQCILRDSPWIAFGIITILFAIAHDSFIKTHNNGAFRIAEVITIPVFSFYGYGLLFYFKALWLLTETIFLFRNSKLRTIHDMIAGTSVVKVNK